MGLDYKCVWKGVGVMQPKCDGTCDPICDNCVYYSFNGKDGVYVGNGFCNKLHEHAEPYYFCDDFICFLAEPELNKE